MQKSCTTHSLHFRSLVFPVKLAYFPIYYVLLNLFKWFKKAHGPIVTITLQSFNGCFSSVPHPSKFNDCVDYMKLPKWTGVSYIQILFRGFCL